jgi:hypothetical protein
MALSFARAGLFAGVLVASAAVGVGTDAYAAFGPDGVDRFDGTALDTSTWAERSINAAVTQNDALVIGTASTHGYTEYQTLSVGVPVGGYAEIEARFTARSNVAGETQDFAFGLTSDTAGPDAFVFSDSATAYISANLNADRFSAFAGGGGGGASGFEFPGLSPQLNTSYVIRVERITGADVQLSLYAADPSGNVLLGSLPHTMAVDPGGEMKLFLTASSVDVTFDNAVVVPEPALACGGFALATAALAARRRRRRLAVRSS